MIHILFGFDNVTDEFKPRNLNKDIHYIESPRTNKKIIGWVVGVFRAYKQSTKNDTIFCWYDFQAVLLFWMCHLTFTHRNIACLNILLKKKNTWKNRFVSMLYRKALQSSNFHASVTSPYYGELLKKWLGINFKYIVIHDPLHEGWKVERLILKDRVFVGGRNSRDWNFIIQVAKEIPNIDFLFVMTEVDYKNFKHNIPDNVVVKRNIPFHEFLQDMADSAIVASPVDTEAPAGLMIIFQAALCKSFVISTKTATSIEYITEKTGCALPKDVSAWKEAIIYYLRNPEERSIKAESLLAFLKSECNRDIYEDQIFNLINICES